MASEEIAPLSEAATERGQIIDYLRLLIRAMDAGRVLPGNDHRIAGIEMAIKGIERGEHISRSEVIPDKLESILEEWKRSPDPKLSHLSHLVSGFTPCPHGQRQRKCLYCKAEMEGMPRG